MTQNSKRKLDKLSLDGILLSLTAAPTPPCIDLGNCWERPREFVALANLVHVQRLMVMHRLNVKKFWLREPRPPGCLDDERWIVVWTCLLGDPHRFCI